MASAAARKNWLLLLKVFAPTNRMYASCTSAVASSVCPAFRGPSAPRRGGELIVDERQ